MASKRGAGRSVRSRRRRRGWLLAAIAVVIVAAVAVALYGWSTPAGSRRAEVWTVAANVATGVGTVALVLATVWAPRAARADRERERLDNEELAAIREARKVVVMLHHRPSAATLTIANNGDQPIQDVVVTAPRVGPDEAGYSYEWMAKDPNDWPGEWFEHSLTAYFVQAGGQFAIEGDIYRVGPDQCCTAGQAGDGKKLENTLRIAWTDVTGRRWQRVSQNEPVASAGPASAPPEPPG